MPARRTHDSVLGELRFVDDCTYEAEVEVDGRTVRLSMIVDVCEEESVLAAARALLPTLSTITAEARCFAAETLLELKNESWLREGEGPLTRADLARRLVLEELAFYDGSGAVEIAFGDGDVFWGHTILVARTESGLFEDADIHG